jgi:hypothetical protein
MEYKEAMLLTGKVAQLLGREFARFLHQKGEFVLKGVDVVPVKMPDQRFYAAIVSDTGHFIGQDVTFQKEFLAGFKRSEYFDDIILGLHEEAANYDVPASRYPDPKKLAQSIDFNIRGNDIYITLKR